MPLFLISQERHVVVEAPNRKEALRRPLGWWDFAIWDEPAVTEITVIQLVPDPLRDVPPCGGDFEKTVRQHLDEL